VRHAIKDVRIVFPAQYGKLYTELAHQHNIELTPEELVIREMLDEKIVRHVISLYEFADQALDAMETNNIVKLHDVIEETKDSKMRSTIFKKLFMKILSRKATIENGWRIYFYVEIKGHSIKEEPS
jgi:hypothetical protein